MQGERYDRGKVIRMESNKRRQKKHRKGDGKMKIIEEFIDSLFSRLC